MKNVAIGFIIAGSIGLTACSSTEEVAQVDGATNTKEDMICEYRRVTGSNLKKKICMTRAQREVELERARAEMNDHHNKLTRDSGYTTQ